MPAGAARDHRVVRDDDLSGSRALGDLVDEFHHALTRVEVEGAGGFVGEDQPWPAHERPRDRDALLLAAGQTVGHAVEAVSETDEVEHVGGDLRAPPERPAAGVQQRHRDVLEGGAPLQQVELLEDEPDRRAPQPVAARRRQAADGCVIERDLAAGGQVEKPEEIQERGLPRARTADDRHVIARFDGEVDARQDRQRRLVRREDRASDLAQFQQAHGCRADSQNIDPSGYAVHPSGVVAIAPGANSRTSSPSVSPSVICT